MQGLHKQHIDSWCQAMRHGLRNGRPYSKNCVQAHEYKMEQFLKHFDELSLVNFKPAMMLVPIEQFSKRWRMYEAISCFAKLQIQEGMLEKVYPEI